MNEGENFGTANGGANQPQFSNSFDRPTGAITSSPEGSVPTVSTAGASNSSKFFGGRSKYSSRSSGGSQQSNFAAAQQVASNPNTPQFFSEAIMANNPAPVETERKPKTGLFIGIGVALVAVIAIVLVAVLVPKGGGGGDNPIAELPDDAKTLLSSETYEQAMAFEEAMMNWSTTKVESIWKIFADEPHKRINEEYKEYKKFIEQVNAYNVGQLKSDQKAVFENVKKTAESTSSKYEKIMEGYNLLYAAFKDLDESSRSKVLNSDDAKLKELAVEINDAFTRYKQLSAQLEANNCSDVESELCTSLRSQQAKTEDIPSAPNLFIDFVKSHNDGKSFTDEDAIYDDILKFNIVESEEKKGEK